MKNVKFIAICFEHAGAGETVDEALNNLRYSVNEQGVLAGAPEVLIFKVSKMGKVTVKPVIDWALA